MSLVHAQYHSSKPLHSPTKSILNYSWTVEESKTNIIIFYRILSIHSTLKCTALGPSNLLSYTTCLHQQPPLPISPCTLISDTKRPPLSPPPLPIQRSIWLSLNLPHPPVSHQHHRHRFEYFDIGTKSTFKLIDIGQ